MIDINVCPPELRKRRKKQLLPKINIPLEVIIGLGGGLLILLVFVHIVLLLVNVQKIQRLKGLQAQWQQILPGKEGVDQVLNQMRSLRSSKKTVNDLTKGDAVLWGQKMNLVSDLITKGVWLTVVEVKNDGMQMKGRAISRQNEEMINIHSFVSALKNSDDFRQGFGDVTLDKIQTTVVNGVDVAEFLIKVDLK